MKARYFLLAAVLIAALTVPGQAQVQQRTKVNFEFTAGDKVLPAGEYDLIFQGTPARSVVVRGAKSTARVNIVTQLAPRGGQNADKLALVFDTIGEKKYLSEIWVPGSQGLLVRTTQEKHEHETVTSAQ